jgi:hypothetical protein
MADLIGIELPAISLVAYDVDRSHSGNNIRMTAPERLRFAANTHAVVETVDPDDAGIDPLARLGD